MKQIGFIGGGRITRIICKGLARSNALPSAIVYDNSSGALSVIEKASLGVATTNKIEDTLKADLLILAVHPAAMVDVLQAINGKIDQSTIVLSLSPKISIARTQELLGGHNLVARMNPNAPSIVGKGFNPVAFSPDFGEQNKQELLQAFSQLGKMPVVEDRLLESFAVITAMGPTYLDYQIDLLKDLALKFGIPEALAREGIRSMVDGAAATVLSEGISENPLDLVPVRPLKELEEPVRQAYRTRLQERHAMLTR